MLQTDLRRLIVAVALVALVMLIAAVALAAPASADKASRNELILSVAAVSANEGALWNFKDAALVWQTTEGHGATDQKRLKWLKKHSPRVLGDKCIKGNCQWTRDLVRSPKTVPAWIAASGPGEQWWLKVQDPVWRRLLLYVRRLVDGTVIDRPCLRTPYTWGSPILDAENAKAEGLVRLLCKGVLNDGYVYLR